MFLTMILDIPVQYLTVFFDFILLLFPATNVSPGLSASPPPLLLGSAFPDHHCHRLRRNPSEEELGLFPSLLSPTLFIFVMLSEKEPQFLSNPSALIAYHKQTNPPMHQN